MKKLSPLAQCHIGAFLLGFTALFAKLIQLPADVITCIRSAIGAIALFGFLKVNAIDFRPKSLKDAMFLLIIGLLMAIHWVTYFHSVQISTVAIGLISLFTFPVITAVLEPYFFKERLKLVDGLCALGVFGSIWLIVPQFSWDSHISQGVFWGVLSAIMLSCRNLLGRKYIQNYSSSVLMSYQAMVTAIVTFPFLIPQLPLEISTTDMIYLAMLGVGVTALGHGLIMQGLFHLQARTVSVITSLQLGYGILWGVIFLHEIPSLRVIIGGTLIVLISSFETYRHRQKT